MSVTQVHPVAEIERIVTRGISGGAYPGAVVAIGTADTVLLLRGYGGLTWRADAGSPTPDSTLYDLASLTKVVATTPALMLLVDRGVISLGDPVSRYVPDFVGEGKEGVQVRHLLEHTSGLRAFLPLNELARSAAEARALVVTEPLRWPVGERVEYSDLNAMLAGWVVEGASEGRGLALDEFVRDSVHRPLNMMDTRYRLPKEQHARAAPINRWRGTPIRGVVHDQNAEVLGGVSGHAGLYSTGADLARYARMWLARGGTAPAQFVSSSIVAKFTRRRNGNRALGWEVNDTSSTGHTGSLLSAAAFGHGGYTGTSIWIDPTRDLFVILLTNRTYAPRTSGSISLLRAVRGELADAAVRLRERSCVIATTYSTGSGLRCP
jgi:serine-type D-Ala-D-Ala carboxypeptidase